MAGSRAAVLRAGRGVPFALFVHTLIVLWYARYGHDPADIDDRRAAQPWYRSKTEPAFEDMVIKPRGRCHGSRRSSVSPRASQSWV